MIALLILLGLARFTGEDDFTGLARFTGEGFTGPERFDGDDLGILETQLSPESKNRS
jgi:hypothetical protein